MKNQRAYTVLNIKSTNDDERVIEGIATTPSADRMNDIVEPLGAKFALPMPLLWQHDRNKPVGSVEFATPTKEGIPFRARIAKIDEDGKLKERVEEAWQSVKHGLVRAVSIGFKPLEYSFIEDSDGIKFTSWEWLELSLVTIPANQEANITNIKRYDVAPETALGKDSERQKNQSHIVRLNDCDQSETTFIINEIKR